MQREPHRRRGARLAGAAAVLLLLPLAATADMPGDPEGWASPSEITNPPPHPRLFVTRAQLERAIAGRGEAFAGIEASVEAAATAALEDREDPLAGESIWVRAIRMQDRIMSLVVQWHRTRDRRYLDAALQDIETIRRWVHPHQVRLVEGQLATCLAVVYDLLYDDLTPAQRARLVEIAREDFIEPFLRNTGGRRRMWWQGQISNWNPVSSSGFGVLALAMVEHEPEAQAVIDRVHATYQPIFDYVQETEGGWVEGLGYWNWSMRYMSQFLISHERTSRRSHPGFRSAGFRRALTFGTYFAPHNEACGFGNNQHGNFSPQLLAAAEHLRDRDTFRRLLEYWLRQDEAIRVKAERRAGAAGAPAGPWRGGGPYELLMLPDPPDSFPTPRRNKVHTFPVQGWSMLADRWPNPNVYAAVRGGQLGGHHTHQDLLSWHGVVGVERMILNITVSDYYNTAWAGRAHEIYEKGSASKNTLFIGGLAAYTGGPRQRGGRSAQAHASHFQLPTGPALRLDATAAYWLTRSEPRLVSRLFTTIDDRGLLVLDRIITQGQHPVEARAFTVKEAEFGERDVLLRGEFETARMTFAADQPAVLRRAVAVLTDGHRDPPTMIRWQTYRQANTVTLATLLTRGEAPVELTLDTSESTVRVIVESEDWRRELRFDGSLRPQPETP